MAQHDNFLSLRTATFSRDDNLQMKAIAELSRQDNLQMKEISLAAQRDSSDMRAIAVLTLIFLPATFVAVSHTRTLQRLETER